MGYTIQIKRATAARWIDLNPILEEGEPGVETDSSKLKIGDGVTEWVNLPYSSGGGETPVVEVTAAEVSITDTSGNFTSTDVEGALSELFTNVNNGKGLIATAIVDKGGTASGSDTFPTLAQEIIALPTGGGESVTLGSSDVKIAGKSVVVEERFKFAGDVHVTMGILKFNASLNKWQMVPHPTLRDKPLGLATVTHVGSTVHWEEVTSPLGNSEVSVL